MSYVRERFKFIYDQFICLKGEPRKIAMGMAVGAFVGVTPTIPFHTALTAFFSVVLRQNFAAACLSSWIVSNPITIPFLYLTQYRFGQLILGNDRCVLVFSDFSICSIFKMGGDIMIPLLLGGIIMAAVIAVPAYFISLHIIIAVREKIKNDNTRQAS